MSWVALLTIVGVLVLLAVPVAWATARRRRPTDQPVTTVGPPPPTPPGSDVSQPRPAAPPDRDRR